MMIEIFYGYVRPLNACPRKAYKQYSPKREWGGFVHSTINGKTVIGLIEKIEIENSTGSKKVQSKVDTGATKSSIDIELAQKLHLGPVIRSKIVKSAHGHTIRPIVEITITLAGKRMTEEFTLADRKHMKYPVLIGQNVLRHKFLIDPTK
jgi:hypothetical protein